MRIRHRTIAAKRQVNEDVTRELTIVTVRSQHRTQVLAIVDRVALVRSEMLQRDLMIVWGSGGTLRRMGEHVNLELTLLGIDAQGPDIDGQRTLYADLNEQDLLSVLAKHVDENGAPKPRLLLLSPMGGQGFLIGRGNLQLSPEVLRVIEFENILGVATPAKLIGLQAVRIDTGDPELDSEFQAKRFVKILQGFRTTRLIRIEEA